MATAIYEKRQVARRARSRPIKIWSHNSTKRPVSPMASGSVLTPTRWATNRKSLRHSTKAVAEGQGLSGSLGVVEGQGLSNRLLEPDQA